MTVKKRSRKTKRLLWITDPWQTLDHARDTTLRLAQEASLLGVEQYWCDVKSIRLTTGVKDRVGPSVWPSVWLDAKRILSVGPSRSSDSFEWGAPAVMVPTDFESIHYRPDPPVDAAYLHPLQMLHLALHGSRKTEVVNPLEVLLSLNEKMEATALKELMPPSLVSSQKDQLVKFGKSWGRSVLKPLDDAQSHGIELLDWRKPDRVEDAERKLEEATNRYSVPIILQQYLEGIADGETRLWFLDGQLLTFAKKYPVTGDFRVDMDRGSQLKPTRLTPKEKAKAAKIGRHLRQRRIRLAAIDLIEGYVTDFNFTSPGLITQMEAVSGENLSRIIVKTIAT